MIFEGYTKKTELHVSVKKEFPDKHLSVQSQQ